MENKSRQKITHLNGEMQRRLPIASLRVNGLPVLDQLVDHAHVALPFIIILIYLNILFYNYHVALPCRCVDSSSTKLVWHQQWHTALK